MKIEEYYNELLREDGVRATVAAAALKGHPEATKADMEEYVRVLGEHLAKGNRKEAIATALSLVMANAASTIRRLRRNGHLRASRCKYEAGTTAKVVTALLAVQTEAGIPADQVDYLNSVLALYTLAPTASRIYDEILDFLRLKRAEALKTLLVVVNELFTPDGPHEPAALLADHTREEIIEAVSMILDILKREFQISSTSFVRTDERALEPQRGYLRIIEKTLQLRKLREAETFIDALPYQAKQIKKSVVVTSIDPQLERAVRLGYIQTQLQRQYRLPRLDEIKKHTETLSLDRMVKEIFEHGFGATVKVHEEPVRRLVFEMPVHPDFMKLIFDENSIFEEEIIHLLHLSADTFDVPFDGIAQVTEKLSNLDIFKIQRLFRFIAYAFQRKLEQIDDETDRNLLRWRSILPVMEHDTLVEMIKLILPQEAEEALRLLTLADDRDHIDLQYTPFIKLDKFYLMAPRLIAGSNLVRNLVLANHLRPALVAKIDPMQQKVSTTLEKSGFRVRQEFELKISGKKYEIDIIAWRDGVLFLFECKNAFLPNSVHEMRNSYEHIVKAGEQSALRLDVLQVPENQEILYRGLGWDLSPTAEVYTGILIANRVFHGYSQDGHPVRQAHELINVLQTGEIRMNGEDLVFWKGDEFHADDLVDYLGDQSIVAKQMSMLKAHTQSVAFGSRTLEFPSYYMDLELIVADFKSRYRVKPKRSEVPEVANAG